MPGKKNKTTKKSPKSKKISKNILIGELLEKYPKSFEILSKHGFHCIGCSVSPYESLAAGAAVHGIPVEPLIEELNKSIK
ncbi:MAG: DUF1858 domain-containing protein [Patescibacteria group bacterium]